MYLTPDKRQATAIIHSQALKHNLLQVKKFAPNSRILAMVKANGYGHGIKHVVSALNKADGYGVAALTEAMQIRELPVTKPVLLTAGFFAGEELSFIKQNDISVVIHSIEQVNYLQRHTFSHPLKIWLKVDTGMHRLGFLLEELGSVMVKLQAIPGIIKPFVIMSHFACADEIEHPLNAMQMKLFKQVMQDFPGHQYSMANSAALINFPEMQLDWVRPGIMLYGISPMRGRIAKDYNLQAVMELQAQLIEKKIITKGGAVGYGSRWIAPETMPIGIIAMGYGDGYPAHAPCGTPVLLGDKLCPIVGRVSMDLICLDLRNNPDAEINETATLWGQRLPIEQIAETTNTLRYELVTKITSRERFCYID